MMEPIAIYRVEEVRRKQVEAILSRPKMNKILVPISASSASLGLVRYAGALARFFGASVCLLHVVPCDFLTQKLLHLGLSHFGDGTSSTAARRLIELTHAELAPELRGGALLRVGDPVREITAAAKALGIDLIILSIQGDSGLNHGLFSGVAERVVRQQPCPILTVRDDLLPSGKDVPSALAWKRILVPVDLTEFSRVTVEWAAGLAARLSAKIIIRYAPGLFAEHHFAKATTGSPPKTGKIIATEFRLTEWVNLSAVGSVEVDLLPEMERLDAHVVGQMIRRAGNDLIVTGLPRHSGWHTLMHGGAAEQLRRVAPCPVLSVPDRDLEHCADAIAA